MPRPLDVAERALRFLDAGLVSVSGDLVVVVAIRNGRAGRAEGPAQDLERLARAATLRARQARAWPVQALPPATVGEVDRGGPITEAIATTWGTRTFESREPTRNSNNSCSGRVRLEDGQVIAADALLLALAPVYGVELALGEPPPVASPAVTLVDDHADTHAFDAEGVRRRRVVLVERGRFVQGVRDSAAGDSTGHATRPLTLAPSADHLRLEPTTDDVGPVTRAGSLRAAEARALLSRVVAVA